MNDYLQFGGTGFLTRVQRPNGKWYRPRKLRAVYIDADCYDQEDHVLVLGTHDLETATLVALEERRKYSRATLTTPLKGWWRLGIIRDEQTWVWDETRGAAGITFRLEEL